jgi:hypothetical protein
MQRPTLDRPEGAADAADTPDTDDASRDTPVEVAPAVLSGSVN